MFVSFFVLSRRTESSERLPVFLVASPCPRTSSPFNTIMLHDIFHQCFHIVSCPVYYISASNTHFTMRLFIINYASCYVALAHVSAPRSSFTRLPRHRSSPVSQHSTVETFGALGHMTTIYAGVECVGVFVFKPRCVRFVANSIHDLVQYTRIYYALKCDRNRGQFKISALLYSQIVGYTRVVQSDLDH